MAATEWAVRLHKRWAAEFHDAGPKSAERAFAAGVVAIVAPLAEATPAESLADAVIHYRGARLASLAEGVWFGKQLVAELHAALDADDAKRWDA